MIIIGDEPTQTNASIEEKLLELCQAILSDSRVNAARAQVDAFFEDDQARDAYATLAQKHDELHRMQHAGEELSESDVALFNKLRDRAFSNPVVQQFTSARAALQEVEDKITAYVEKTLELGRVPEEHEVTSSGGGCCGGGGGGGGCCSH
jgi:cell fate (sporulation/competence/biofilm development) regulator YlbF (YheA/YmcA/DUF963 family)